MSSLRYHLALDSGAHSLFNRHLLADNGGMAGERLSSRAAWHARGFRPAYLRTKEFRKYLDDYLAFLKLHQDKMDFCVAVDIINLVEKGTNVAPQRSYELWHEFHRQGFKVMPVLHYGEDPVWLKKYMDECDYIGIGGMAQYSSSKGLYAVWASKVFKALSDKRGRMKWKTHGFAMSSFKLMQLYPWTSVDSTTPIYLSRMGALCIPRGAGDYLSEPGSVFVTPRKQRGARCYSAAAPLWKAKIEAYLESLGTTVAEVSNSNYVRDMVNIFFFFMTARAISQKREGPPLKAYLSGNPSGGWRIFLEHVPRLASFSTDKVLDFHYLGTYFLPTATKKFLELGYYGGYHENFRPSLRPQPRPTLHRRH